MSWYCCTTNQQTDTKTPPWESPSVMQELDMTYLQHRSNLMAEEFPHEPGDQGQASFNIAPRDFNNPFPVARKLPPLTLTLI